jgi:sugar-specific transcriptional regulator TrmB
VPEDLLTRIRKQVAARQRELEGAVAEYGRLEAAARMLDAGGRRPSGTPRAARRSTRRRAASAPRVATAARKTRKRAPRGANREAILAALRGRRGGTSASELAKRAGVGRVSSYQVLTGLEREGLVRRDEQSSGPALYSLR